MRRSGQADLIGVALAGMIILSIIMVFLFVLPRAGAPSFEADYSASQTATNFPKAFIEITVPECGNARMADLINDATSGAPVVVCEDGEGSGEKIAEVARTILASTLDTRKQAYEFSIRTPAKEYLSEGDCAGREVINPTAYPLPYNDVELILEIC